MLLLVLWDVTHSIVTKWKQLYYSTTDNPLLEYDNLLLHALTDYIIYCVRFAWCALTQVPPLKIDHSAAVESLKCQVVSQAFHPLKDGAALVAQRVRPFCVICGLSLKIVIKGEVVLPSYH